MKKVKHGVVVKHYRVKRPDDIEEIIRLCVQAQSRLAKQGIQLAWHMSWQPVAEKKP